MKKTTAKKKKEIKKTVDVDVKKITEFKIYCIKNNITQVELRDLTELSIGCIHATWHGGRASNSTIKLISLALKLNEDKVRSLITTFVSNNEKNKEVKKEVKKEKKSRKKLSVETTASAENLNENSQASNDAQ